MAHQLLGTEDAAQQVVEVVGDAATELADRFHLLCLAQGLLGLGPFCQCRIHPLFQLLVQALQGLLCPSACGDVLEQYCHLALFGRLYAEGGHRQHMAGGDQFLLEMQRLARAQHRAITSDPIVGLIGHHLAQFLPDHVGDAGVLGIGRIGQHMHIVAQWAVRAVEELDDAEALVHGVEERAVEVLVVLLMACQAGFQQRVLLLQGFDLLAQ
ncbi:hypothetical protein D3C77_545690 [compost metagenome]